jgi:hypothetical protein
LAKKGDALKFGARDEVNALAEEIRKIKQLD